MGTLPDPKYPVPDRSDFKPNQHRNDPELPEGDIGSCTRILPDGRAYVQESWYSEGFTFITLFFSTLDLELAEPGELLALLGEALEQARVPAERRTLGAHDVRRITDSSGKSMFSLTFVVGEPDL
jgi:hypothetical protein